MINNVEEIVVFLGLYWILILYSDIIIENYLLKILILIYAWSDNAFKEPLSNVHGGLIKITTTLP